MGIMASKCLKCFRSSQPEPISVTEEEEEYEEVYSEPSELVKAIDNTVQLHEYSKTEEDQPPERRKRSLSSSFRDEDLDEQEEQDGDESEKYTNTEERERKRRRKRARKPRKRQNKPEEKQDCQGQIF